MANSDLAILPAGLFPSPPAPKSSNNFFTQPTARLANLLGKLVIISPAKPLADKLPICFSKTSFKNSAGFFKISSASSTKSTALFQTPLKNLPIPLAYAGIPNIVVNL